MDINKISSVLSVWDIAKALFGLLVLVFGFIIIFFRSIKVSLRLGKNLGRKIFVFCPPGGKKSDGTDRTMEPELKVLKSSGYFNIPKSVITDYKTIDDRDIQDAGVVILGYHNGMTNFAEFVSKVDRFCKPLIIYTFDLSTRLDENHLKELEKCKWYVLSSMPLRLVGDLFSIMSSYKYE